MTLVTSAQAAERLGVSVRQAQRLVRDGLLESVGQDRIDYSSVTRLAARRQGHHRRVWAEATAWAAIAYLSQINNVDWLGQAQRSRLKAAIRELARQNETATWSQFASRTRNRALVLRYRVHPAALSQLRSEVISSGSDRELGELTAGGSDHINGYVETGRLELLIDRYRMVSDLDGNLTLRMTEMRRDVIETVAGSSVLAALDLSESTDERMRQTGGRLLEAALSRWR